MNWKTAELSYRRAAVENASAVGLVIILYDVLVRDLKRAMEAIHACDIDKRSAELKHALLVLQQLEGSLDMEKGGEAARNLSSFYSVVRCKIMEAQVKSSSEILDRQIELLLDVRKAWQQVDPGQTASAASVNATPQPSSSKAAVVDTLDEPQPANWTA